MIGLLVVAATALGLTIMVRRDRVRRRLVRFGSSDAPIARWRLAHEREALIGLGIGLAMRGVTGAWLGAAVGVVFAELRKRRSGALRLQRIERQVPELVRSLVASLRVGGDVAGAFANASDELSEPIAAPVRAVGRRLAAGASLDEALEGLRADVACDGIERLVDAIRTATEVGGDLDQILRFIGEQVRDRIEVDRQRVAATSQGRLSAIVVGGMPLAFLAMTGTSSSSPSRILLTEPVGWMLLAIGLSLEAVGFFWVHRVVRP